MPEYAVQKLAISEKRSSLLISCIGILNTIGMILYGYLADRSWVNRVLFYAISSVICGAVLFLIPWLHSYALWALASGIFGFFISANYTLTSVILLELLSLSDFIHAYGLVCFVQGVGTLVGPPLAGKIGRNSMFRYINR